MSTSSEFLKLVVPLHVEISALKEENEKLKLTIEDGKKMNNNFEKENEYLKEEINNIRAVPDLGVRENEAGDTSCLEEKCRNLETENKKLNVEVASKNLQEIELKELRNKLKLVNENKSVFELMEQIENYKQINIHAADKVGKFARQIEKHKRDYEEYLKNYIFEYDKCIEDLKQQAITVQDQSFPRLLVEFRQLCHEHDIKVKHIFNTAYEIDKNVTKKSEEIQKLMSQNLHEIKQSIHEETRKLSELRRFNFYNNLNLEKKNYENLIKIAVEETFFIKNLLLVNCSSSTAKNIKPNDKSTNNSKAFNNNYKQTNKAGKNKSFNNSTNKDLYKPEQKEVYSVIMHNFPESSNDKKNDVLELKFFLMKELYIKDVDDVVAISRVGLGCSSSYDSYSYHRPAVVTLSNQRIYHDILKHANRKIPYRGVTVQIYKNDKLDLL